MPRGTDRRKRLSNTQVLVVLFKSLRALTPGEVVAALRIWLLDDCIPHAERTHDDPNYERWRNLLALLPDWHS